MKICSKCKLNKPFSDFYSKGNQCKQCQVKRARNWQLNNSERYKNNLSRNYLENVVLRQENARAYYAANPARERAVRKKYRQTFHEKKMADNAHRRALELQATPDWCEHFIIEEAYHLAKLREQATGIKWQVDHMVPLKSKLVCGLHAHTNIQVITAIKNAKKLNRTWPDMW
jgi:hypothetical protein